MTRILALDVGEKRIGVAVSDCLNITAQGQGMIKNKDTTDTLNKIKDLIKQYDISKIIVGMPFNMNGTKGYSARSVEAFVERLKKEVSIDVEIADERLTTAQGERVLLEADVSREKRKKFVDKIAAQLILQSYLDSPHPLTRYQ